MNRICMYTKDVQIITGKSEKTSRILLDKIKAHLGKEKHQPITLDEFCAYMKIDKATINLN